MPGYICTTFTRGGGGTHRLRRSLRHLYLTMCWIVTAFYFAWVCVRTLPCRRCRVCVRMVLVSAFRCVCVWFVCCAFLICNSLLQAAVAFDSGYKHLNSVRVRLFSVYRADFTGSAHQSPLNGSALYSPGRYSGGCGKALFSAQPRGMHPCAFGFATGNASPRCASGKKTFLCASRASQRRGRLEDVWRGRQILYSAEA